MVFSVGDYFYYSNYKFYVNTLIVMNEQALYFHAFNLFYERIGPARFKKLLGYFGSLEKAWKESGVSDFVAAGLEEDLAREIATRRPQIDLTKEMAQMARENIEIITILDENYPKLLKEIYDPPYIMYLKGVLKPEEDEFSLAIVGTRRLSPYGYQATEKIAYDLAQTGITIVSGLAQGIDTLAHLGAVKQKKRTIAVLGSSLGKDDIFPPVNRKLAEMIIQEGGAILSEYPLGAPALPHHFPFRNRIVSGISLGVLVIEAPEKSGALLTARHALEQNREVFALPGSIFSQNSLGPNNLIKMGAKLVTGAQDILEELNLKNLVQNIETRQILADTKEEQLILDVLSHEPLPIDKIGELTKLETSLINSTLSLMEMKGKVRNSGGAQYVLAR